MIIKIEYIRDNNEDEKRYIRDNNDNKNKYIRDNNDNNEDENIRDKR